jgi:hypothetical protein
MNNAKVPNGNSSSKFQFAFGIFIFLLIIGLVMLCIYKLVTAAGIKPRSKKSKESCGLDIECQSNMCRFGICI